MPAQSTSQATTEMVVRIRGNKVTIDLDETTQKTLTDLAKITEFDVGTVFKTALLRGIQQTTIAALTYREKISGARDEFMTTVSSSTEDDKPEDEQETGSQDTETKTEPTNENPDSSDDTP